MKHEVKQEIKQEVKLEPELEEEEQDGEIDVVMATTPVDQKVLFVRALRHCKGQRTLCISAVGDNPFPFLSCF